MLLNIDRFFQTGQLHPVLAVLQGINARDDLQFGPMREGIYLAPAGNIANDIGYRLEHMGITWEDCKRYYDEYPNTPGLSKSLPTGLKQAPGFWGESYRADYGVCDDVEQVAAYYVKQIADSTHAYVIGMMPVRKADQPDRGGWRWHKWGEYIGRHEITAEYLYDEPVVEQVYCFHLVELLNHKFWKEWVS